jgi:BirA family biotin operon repressor/biotin-[acetyl-CoA-carboxylase] ligase
MSTKGSIVAELEAAGVFVSGRVLAAKLGVSRTAIWKQIRSLEIEGYAIDRERGRGYRLTAMPGGLSEGEVTAALATRTFGRSLLCKAVTGSTNSDAVALGRQGAPEGTVVIADAQTAGRGRLGRTWVSRPGLNLYLSILLRPSVPPAIAPQLALVAGLAVAETLEGEGLSASIKWPNDVLLAGRKASGILTELEAEADRTAFVVVGIGVNLNGTADDFPPELRSLATSLRLARGRGVDRARFAANLLQRLEVCYARFQTGGFGNLARDWEKRSALVGRDLTVDGVEGKVTGRYAGVDTDGALLLDDSAGAGRHRRVLAGDVTIVGGYSGGVS